MVVSSPSMRPAASCSFKLAPHARLFKRHRWFLQLARVAMALVGVMSNQLKTGNAPDLPPTARDGLSVKGGQFCDINNKGGVLT